MAKTNAGTKRWSHKVATASTYPPEAALASKLAKYAYETNPSEIAKPSSPGTP
jgi:hypothetical protein